MAITGKPKKQAARQAPDGDEKRVGQFIDAGGSGAQREAKRGRVPVLVRLPAELLEQMDAAAAAQFTTRTGFLIAALVEKLERG